MADSKYLDKAGLDKLVNDYLKPDSEPSLTSEHPLQNKVISAAITDQIKETRNLKSVSYGHIPSEANLPTSNSDLTMEIYSVGQRLIADDTNTVFEVSEIDSETGDLTWIDTGLQIGGGGKINAVALADGEAIATVENGFYLNVDDGKIYQAKDGEISESSKEIDHCIIDYQLYRENKESLDQLDIVFVITNAPGSGNSSSNITDDWIDYIEGYYNSTNGNFYSDSAFTTQITGEEGILYVDKTENIIYRFDGTNFTQLGGSSLPLISNSNNSIAIKYEDAPNIIRASTTSLVIGQNNTLSGESALVQGDGNNIATNYGFVSGENNSTSNSSLQDLCIIGTNNYADADNLYLIGDGLKANNDSQRIIGQYNKEIEDNNVTIIGNGTGSTNKSNGLEIYSDRIIGPDGEILAANDWVRTTPSTSGITSGQSSTWFGRPITCSGNIKYSAILNKYKGQLSFTSPQNQEWTERTRYLITYLSENNSKASRGENTQVGTGVFLMLGGSVPQGIVHFYVAGNALYLIPASTFTITGYQASITLRFY